jgi:hypothetical protein
MGRIFPGSLEIPQEIYCWKITQFVEFLKSSNTEMFVFFEQAGISCNKNHSYQGKKFVFRDRSDIMPLIVATMFRLQCPMAAHTHRSDRL